MHKYQKIFKKTKKWYTTTLQIDRLKIQTIFSYWKLPYIDCWFILFLLKRLVTLSLKNCFFLFLFFFFFFFLSTYVLTTNWLTYFIVCLLKFPSGIFRFFPLSVRKRLGKFGFFAVTQYLSNYFSFSWRKIVKQTWLLSPGMATGLGEGKYVKLRPKIDFVSHPTCSVMLVK